jgi:hypothetical protein
VTVQKVLKSLQARGILVAGKSIEPVDDDQRVLRTNGAIVVDIPVVDRILPEGEVIGHDEVIQANRLFCCPTPASLSSTSTG